MNKIKQVIVVRGDLKKMLRQDGKLCAQVSHASLGAVFRNSTSTAQEPQHRFDVQRRYKTIEMDQHMSHWFDVEFTKVIVRCEDEAHLLAIYEQVVASNIPYYALIKDAGHTVFSEPTYTCLGIGPAPSDIIDAITGKLPLL